MTQQPNDAAKSTGDKAQESVNYALLHILKKEIDEPLRIIVTARVG